MRAERRPPLLLAPLLAVCATAGVAAAGSITINMTSTVTYEENQLVLQLQVGNTGDEAAHSVTPGVRFLDHETRGKTRESLGPNEKLDVTLRAPAEGLGVGRWPFRVVVDYTDANQYPFQALHVALLSLGNSPPPRIAIPKMTVPPLATTGRVTVQLKNLAAVARKATVKVFVPDDMEVTSPVSEIDLAPWGETEARLDVANRTALAGSRYPVFAAVEYDEQGIHYTLVAQDVVAIVSARAFLSRWLVWGGAVLVAGWLGFLGWRLRGRRSD
jgi:hypothetical protein